MRTHRRPFLRRATSAALAIVIIPTLLSSVAVPHARAETRGARWRSGERSSDHAIKHQRRPKFIRQAEKRAFAGHCIHRVHARRPSWCRAPGRVRVYKDHPFFFHGGFGIYLGGAVFDVEIASRPPHGYFYIDPICHRSFSTITQYRLHLRRHRHPGFLEVAPIDGRIACR